MQTGLDRYRPIADAIARLFGASVEVVIHDASTGTIAYIANAFSKRRPGDESLIEADATPMSATRVIGPYAKTNWDGHRMRSITAALTDDDGSLVGHLCINHDIEAFAHAQEILQAAVALPIETTMPAELFTGDWREQINRVVSDFLQDRGVALAGLVNEDVDALLRVLLQRRLFDVRNSATYVASVLGCSRATLYARLKQVRGQSLPDDLNNKELAL